MKEIAYIAVLLISLLLISLLLYSIFCIFCVHDIPVASDTFFLQDDQSNINRSVSLTTINRLIVSSTSINSRRTPSLHRPSTFNVDIVVARYNEKVEWFGNSMFANHRVICYNKSLDGPDMLGWDHRTAPTHVYNIENVGRCDHTYLYHIVNNYDQLADVTVFLPASCLDGIKACNTKHVMDIVMRTKTTVLPNTYDVGGDVRKTMYGFQMDLASIQ